MTIPHAKPHPGSTALHIHETFTLSATIARMRLSRHAANLVALSALFVAEVAASAAASANPRVKPVELASLCVGKCDPRLVALSPDRILALWMEAGGAMSAQRIDAATGTLVGPRVSLGHVAIDEEDQHLAVVALPDGDAVLIGALADGRITFTRGSTVAAHRVAPRVILPASGRATLGLAATISGDSVVVVVLRGEHGDPREPASSMDVTLQQVNSRGEPSGPPRSWTAPAGFYARVVHCGDTLFAAWRRGPSVAFTTFSATGERSPLRELPIETIHDLGPLLCVGAEARVFATAAEDQPFSIDPSLRKEIRIASLDAGGPPAGSWRVKPLPGTVREMMPGQGRLYLTLDRGVGKPLSVSALDLSSESLNALSMRPQLLDHCLILADPPVLFCANRKVTRLVRECNYVENKLLISPPVRAGAGGTPATDAGFFDVTGGLGDDDHSGSRAAPANVVRCGDASWAPLRAALDGWCSVKNRKKLADLKEICRPDNPTSLLYQATNCTSLPLTCGKAKGRDEVLEVEASQIAGGAVELKYMGCSVDLARSGEGWKVSGQRCEE